MTTDRAYRLGYDCGYSGPNLTNSSHLIFSCKENTLSWEMGKKDGEMAKNQKQNTMRIIIKYRGADPHHKIILVNEQKIISGGTLTDTAYHQMMADNMLTEIDATEIIEKYYRHTEIILNVAHFKYYEIKK